MNWTDWIVPYLGLAIVMFGWFTQVLKKDAEPLWAVAVAALLWPIVLLGSIGYAIGKFIEAFTEGLKKNRE